MSEIVVTGTGLLTAAGFGPEVLQQALASGRCFVERRADGLRCSSVPTSLITWPANPEWQPMHEYAGLASQLTVVVCQHALANALRGAQPFNTERAATIAVTGDDWNEQHVFDRAVASAMSTRLEARSLFTELDDQFLLRTFRWAVGFGIGALTSFQGPSANIDHPSFAGLAGLEHALRLIESGEVDTVMLVGVDTTPRLDVAASMEAVARQAGKPPLGFGQGAAAIVLERSSSAHSRGAPVLASVASCEHVLAEEPALALRDLVEGLESSPRFSSSAALGSLLSAGALVDFCLASEWLALERAEGRSSSATIEASETFWASGAAAASLRTFDSPASP